MASASSCPHVLSQVSELRWCEGAREGEFVGGELVRDGERGGLAGGDVAMGFSTEAIEISDILG
jgi:hypothetical protein